MDYITLAKKKNVRNADGIFMVDLLTPVYVNFDIPASNMIIVNEYYVARPDLISLVIYGTDRYADILCKYNGISNPFEINEDTILFIPHYTTFASMLAQDNPASQFIGDEDDDPVIAEKQHKFQKEKTEVRSPAQQVVGETNFVIDKSLGVVYF